MAVFDHIPVGEEGLREVYSWIDNFVNDNNEIAEKIVLGRSEDDKWEIPAVAITNKSIPNEEKQTAVVTLARHGQELGTRVVGPEIMQYLITDDASEIRDKQLVIVVPVVNPIGFVLGEFHSSMTSLTKTERLVLGKLFRENPPDAIIDYHSLGKSEGCKYDRGDMEVIIPANTTKWAMDEQIHQYVAQAMKDFAEAAGWPYEIHTLEDLASYYFGGPEIGNMPWRYMQEKVYLLHTQDFYDNYDVPEESAYTNYTCGPAYLKWHSLVIGMETNHHGISKPQDIAASGLAPCVALLKMGLARLNWEKDEGYPVNILHGDFRISLRPVGKNAAERRLSRIQIWNERHNFSLPLREMPDQETTVAKVRYFGRALPMEFALCLRMRQVSITSVTTEEKEIQFTTFRDNCSLFIHIPIVMEKPGTVEITIKHSMA